MASLQHMKQLAGLRGLAIFGVFLFHFLLPPVEHPFFMPYGSMGVRLFFVLSGFLITGVLIKARDQIDAGRQSVAYTLRAFYARRCLRLFVVFYAWLIATQFVFGGPRFWWDALYLSNFYDIFFSNGRGNHYWSLAVEEQFYLVWPVLILFLKRKFWPAMFIACIAIAILTRFAMAIYGFEYLIVKKFPVACMDCLAAGGLVAWLFYRAKGWSQKSQTQTSRICAVLGVTLFACAMYSLKSTGAKGMVYNITLHNGFAALFTGVLIPAIEGYKGWTGKFLSAAPLCWLGRISYGCYLYHLLIRNGIDSICRRHSIELPLLIDFAIKMSLSLLVAWLSWTIPESRVNHLKKYFPMKLQKFNSGNY